MMLVDWPRSDVALLYHDVIPRDHADRSGVTTEGAWRYKVSPERFRRHLEFLSTSRFTPGRVTDQKEDALQLLLTFDDGGVSCSTTVAPMLEEYDFPGHFFLITDRIDDPKYVSSEQVEVLSERGHIIGSHTRTHPDLTQLSRKARQRELQESREAIKDIVGECCTLSIPRGRCNNTVIRDAFDVGYEYVFTSEPTRIRGGGYPRTIGRWNVWHDTSVERLNQIVEGDVGFYLRNRTRWIILKMVKRTIGFNRFVRLRDALL